MEDLTLPELEEVDESWQYEYEGRADTRHSMTLRQRLKRELEEESPFFTLDGTTFYKIREEEQRVRSDLKQHSEHSPLARQSELLIASSRPGRSTSPLKRVYTPEEPVIAPQISMERAQRGRTYGEEMIAPSVLQVETMSESSEDPFAGLSSPSVQDPFGDPFGDPFADAQVHQASDPFREFDGVTDAVFHLDSPPLETRAQRRKMVPGMIGAHEVEDFCVFTPTSRQSRQARLERLTRKNKDSHDGNAVSTMEQSTQTEDDEPRTAQDKQRPQSVDDLPFALKSRILAEMQELKNELNFYQVLHSTIQCSASAGSLTQEFNGRIISRQRCDVEKIAYLSKTVERLRRQNSLDGAEIAVLRAVKANLEVRCLAAEQAQMAAKLRESAMLEEKKMLARCLRKTRQEREDLALEIATTKLEMNKKRLGRFHEDICRRYRGDSRDIVPREPFEPDVIAIRGGLQSLHADIDDCEAVIRCGSRDWSRGKGVGVTGNG